MGMTLEDKKRLERAAGGGGASGRPVSPVVPLALPVPAAMAASGLSRSAIYREAGRGNIRLLKLGRTTLVDMASVRAFLATLPVAPIRAPRGTA
jgi:hypothetical protein